MLNSCRRCLTANPKQYYVCSSIEEKTIDFVMTSPPYLDLRNAIEMVFLSYNETEIKNLRQKMLSCTVENKDRRAYLKRLY